MTLAEDSVAGPCPEASELLALAQGAVGSPKNSGLLRHLSECRACRAAIAVADITTRPGSSVVERSANGRRKHADPLRLTDLGHLAEGLERFLPIDVLGAGGMGVVFRAYDPTLSREVAIKTIRPDGRLPATAIDLLAEARTMARVSHANIVQVYDVDVTDSNSVRIIMEYIEGPTLRHWLGDQSPSPAEILDVFCGAARGLAAAHRCGVLHGDFKPSNVMIAPQGVAKVTDFGLARVDDPRASVSGAALTRSDASGPAPTEPFVAGTPRYMAPEQHYGHRISTQSDQYSLCLALWEALTGTYPFGSSQPRAGKSTGPPPWPDCGVDAGIGAALHRGLSPDPAERWPSIDALLTELQRVRTSRKRRWTGLAGAGIGVLALGALAMGTSDSSACRDPRLLKGVWDTPARQALQTTFTRDDVPYSGNAWAYVSGELDAYAARWTEEHAAVCRATGHDAAERSPPDARLQCLGRSRAALRSSVQVLSEPDPRTLERAHELVRALPAPEDCVEAHMRPASASADEFETILAIREDLAMASSLRYAARYQDAARILENAQRKAQDAGFEPIRTDIALERGLLDRASGNSDAARENLVDALASAVRQANSVVALEAALALGYSTGVEGGQVTEAGTYAELAEELAEDPIARARVWVLLGKLAEEAGRFQEAENAQRRALSAFLRERPPTDPLVISARSALANAVHQLGRFDEAERENRALMDVMLPIVGPHHPQIASFRVDLGIALRNQGRLDEAEIEIAEALRIRQASLGFEHRSVAEAHNDLGAVFIKRGDLQGAAEQYHAALSVSRRTLGDDHTLTTGIRGNLASVAYELKDFEGAERQMRATLDALIRTMGAEHPQVALTRQNIASVLHMQKRYEEAASEWERALDLRIRTLGVGHEKVAMTRSNYAMTLLELERFSEALRHARESWRIRKDADLQPAQKGSTAFLLARALIQTDPQSAAEARELANTARSLYQLDPSDHASEIAEISEFLAKTFVGNAARPSAAGARGGRFR